MTNKEIYFRTLGFSLRRFLFGLLSVIALVVFSGAGIYLGMRASGSSIIYIAVGVIIGIVVLVLILRYIAYSYKAGQIAMMTEAIKTGTLPDDVISAGKQAVRERFTTVAAYFAVTLVIKGIFNQLGRVVTKVGGTIGGNTGEAVGNTINSVIQVVISYLSDCCLGWVFYRGGQSAARSTCEGAVLFFKKWKTLARNMGRVFGIGIISLLIIGGILTGVFYMAGGSFPEAFDEMAKFMTEAAADPESNIPAFLTSAANLRWVVSALIAVIIWGILHGTFIRPFVLTGVLRNFIESGRTDIPSEDSFAMLDSKSRKFRKLHGELA